eukprot:3550769-Pyramimonas_sp.AAC.1
MTKGLKRASIQSSCGPTGRRKRNKVAVLTTACPSFEQVDRRNNPKASPPLSPERPWLQRLDCKRS